MIVIYLILILLVTNFNVFVVVIQSGETVDVSDFVQLWTDGYGSPVDVEYSPDGSEIAIASSIGLLIFNSEDYSLDRKFIFRNESIIDVCWSPDGSKIALGIDEEIRIVDSKFCREMNSINSPCYIEQLRWAPDGSKIATSHGASYRGGLNIFNLDDGSLLVSIPDEYGDSWRPIYDFSWSPDSEMIIFGNNSNLTVINSNTGEIVKTISSKIESMNYSGPYSCSNPKWSYDGSKIAYIIEGKNINYGESHWKLQIMDYNTNVVLCTTPLGCRSYNAWSFIWSKDNTKIIASIASTLLYYNISEIPESKWINYSKISEEFTLPSKYSISSDGENIVVISQGHNWIRILNTNTLETISTIQKTRSFNDNMIAYSPDKNEFAFIDRASGNVAIFDMSKRKTIRYFNETDVYFEIKYSPDGSKIAYVKSNKIVIINSFNGKNILNITDADQNSIQKIFWSPDGNKISSRSYHEKNKTKIWNATTGELVLTIDTPTDYNFPMDWSKDGKKIITGSTYGNLTIWNTNSGERLFEFSNEYPYPDRIYSIDWGFKNNKIATGLELNDVWYIGIWDQTGFQNKFLNLDSLKTGGGQSPSIVRWSPDGTYISNNYNGIVIWEYNTNDITLLGSGQIYTFAWSTDGKNIITGHLDGTIRCWGKPLDINLTGEDIRYSNNNPKIGENITISVDIKNEGKFNASDFWVDFYVDGVKIAEKQIDFLERDGGIKTLETFFTPTKKEQKIEVIVDSDNFLPEFNKENNVAKSSINSIEEFNIGEQTYVFILVGMLLILLVIVFYYRRKK